MAASAISGKPEQSPKFRNIKRLQRRSSSGACGQKVANLQKLAALQL
jgi:hypothetical protein